MLKLVKNNKTLLIVLGDLTEFDGECIVNPANTYLVMGGGVAKAIKDKGGSEIEAEARKHAPIPIGHAVITTAGKLKCRFVIHAPAVQAPGGKSSAENVYKATRASLEKALEAGLKSIAYPLMGAGIGGLSPEESLRSMVRALEELRGELDVYLYVTSKEVFEKVFSELTRLGWVIK